MSISNQKKIYSGTSIFTKVVLTKKITVKFNYVNNKINDLLEKSIKNQIEGLCIDEGYVKNDSVKVLSYSSGELFSNNITFDVIFESLITNPFEGMMFECIVKSITKVGIRAEMKNDKYSSPFIIFIARDHHYNNDLFSKIVENDVIVVKVLGKRFELNDKYISIIAELINKDGFKSSKKELEELE